MNSEELDEVLKMLSDAGWQPQVCDTPIPVYESVHAGNPVDVGQIPPDMELVPRSFLSMYQESMVKVKGNSMADAGIEDGDLVKMGVGRTPRDGDIVVVAIGSECTLKCYYEDDDGTRWLVPQNKAEKEKYKAIRIDEGNANAYVCGVVTEICKPLPRVSTRLIRSLVNEAKASIHEEPKISELRVRLVIKIVGAEIKVARLWYAVCRSMMDKLIFGENQFDDFCDMVKSVLPHHQHLPKEAEMQAMAVESFAKSVSKWVEGNAPVKGKRFKNYKAMADKTTQLLTMSEGEFAKL